MTKHTLRVTITKNMRNWAILRRGLWERKTRLPFQTTAERKDAFS
jgi:hypothetical protein